MDPLSAPRRRSSLYVRAFLVTAAGGLVVVAAALLYARSVAATFEEHILNERLALAAQTGSHVQHMLLDDLQHLVAVGATHLRAPPGGPLSHPPHSIYGDRYFVLDRALVTQGEDALPYEQALLEELAAAARTTRNPAVSGLRSVGGDGGLVVLAPIWEGETLLGYAGGFVNQQDLSSLLPVAPPGAPAERSGRIQLLDHAGRVVAANAGALGAVADHGSVLQRAIRERSPVRGLCHGCHDSAAQALRDSELLAFVPLPRLDLGVAIRQRETDALAPVQMLRERLVRGTLVLLALFFLAAAVSIHSVVRPVVRLARAVRRVETGRSTGRLPAFGNNEVGQLAEAIEQWRGRVDESLASAERHRAALRTEVEASSRLLAALFSVTDSSLQAGSVGAIADNGLRRLVDILGCSAGALRLAWYDERHDARAGAWPADAGPLLDACERMLAPAGAGQAELCRSRIVDARSLPGGSEAPAALVLLAELAAPRGPRVAAALAIPEGPPGDERPLHALLHHVVVSAANQLLKDEERRRERLRREYLGRVLSAQEEERRRVARELHDTVAQDLAALRLALERAAAAAPDPVAGRLRDLEGQAREMLETVRRITLDLRPAVLDAMGFLPALQWHLTRVEREHGLRTSLTVDGDGGEPDRDLAISLFRIFQECLQNVVQHARAEHLFVTVELGADEIGLVTEDDGVGCDPGRLALRQPDEQGHGLGVLGMEERAKMLGGTLRLETSPGEGTTVRVRVPRLPGSEAAVA